MKIICSQYNLTPLGVEDFKTCAQGAGNKVRFTVGVGMAVYVWNTVMVAGMGVSLG